MKQFCGMDYNLVCYFSLLVVVCLQQGCACKIASSQLPCHVMVSHVSHARPLDHEFACH